MKWLVLLLVAMFGLPLVWSLGTLMYIVLGSRYYVLREQWLKAFPFLGKWSRFRRQSVILCGFVTDILTWAGLAMTIGAIVTGLSIDIPVAMLAVGGLGGVGMGVWLRILWHRHGGAMQS